MRHLCFATFAVLLISGCGSKPTGPQKYTVAGAVTLDGQPVAEGVISFDSPDGKAGSGSIKGGFYTAEVPAGMKTVRINAQKPTGKKGPYGEDVTEELIPKQYNAESKEQFEVKTSGDNKKDFALNSKK